MSRRAPVAKSLFEARKLLAKRDRDEKAAAALALRRHQENVDHHPLMEQPARGGEEAAAGLVRGGGHLTDHLGDGHRLAGRDVGTKRPFTLASPSTDAGPSRSKSIRIDDNDNAKNISEDFEESAVVTDEKEGEDKTKRTRSKEEKENLEESAVVTDEKEREDKTKRTRSKEEKEKENLTKQFVRKSLTVKKKISELENYVKKTGTAELEYMVIIKDNVHSKGNTVGKYLAFGNGPILEEFYNGDLKYNSNKIKFIKKDNYQKFEDDNETLLKLHTSSLRRVMEEEKEDQNRINIEEQDEGDIDDKVVAEDTNTGGDSREQKGKLSELEKKINALESQETLVDYEKLRLKNMKERLRLERENPNFID